MQRDSACALALRGAFQPSRSETRFFQFWFPINRFKVDRVQALPRGGGTGPLVIMEAKSLGRRPGVLARVRRSRGLPREHPTGRPVGILPSQGRPWMAHCIWGTGPHSLPKCCLTRI